MFFNHFLLQTPIGVKVMEKPLQQKNPIMTGILEEVRHTIQTPLMYLSFLLIGELMKKVRD